MSEYQETGNVTASALKAGLSRPTAREYREAVQPPGELQAKHTWRTREDPLAEIWPPARGMPEAAPELEAKALFEHLSCRQGWQATLPRLGKVPAELRVDPSRAATPRVGGGGTGRQFNEPFVCLCAHYGLVPRTIGIERPNENGDVESANGHLKRRLGQHLLLRGSRDFESEAAYEGF